ncbi:MAG: Cna B-type domain-containing protein [Lachnospiraceae bacterium]|nr:Cna B-type domain-containing protein [Lachnospiraceae bacterium]
MNSKNKSFRPFLALLLTLAMVLGSVGGFGSGKAAKAAGEAKLTIQASKTLDDAAPAADQFEFQILSSDGKVVKTAKNDAAGKVVFDALTFTAAGTYTYTVKEKVPADAVNHIKNGIQYDSSEKNVVVTVDSQLAISSVTVNGTAVNVETSGGSGNSLGANETAYTDGENIYVNGNGWTADFTDILRPLRMSDKIVYCFDDGVMTPSNEGAAYTEFDTDQAPEFSGANGPANEKQIKKLLYFGAPHDGGGLVQWLMDNGKSYNGHAYTREEAENYLEFMTRELLHNITNPLQGVGFNGDNTPESEGIETYRILDQVIDKQTGELINNAVERQAVYDMMAQQLWKKVIDPSTDSVADIVTLRIYSPVENPHTDRPADRHSSFQRVITAEIRPANAVAVGGFANSTVTQEETPTVTVNVEKQWEGEAGEFAIVQLMRDDIPKGAPVTLNADNEWKYSWTDLEKGPEYKVIEDPSDTYELLGSQSTTLTDEKGNVTVSYTFVNQVVPEAPASEKISVTVEKEWEGEALESVSVQLFADDEAYGDPIILSEDNQWTHSWAELDKTQADGTPIEYRVEEAESDEYILVGFSTANDKEGNLTYHLVNTKVAPETVNVTAEKTWVGEPAAAISFTLTRNNVAVDTQTLTGEPWTYTWTDLPKVDEKGEAYAYFVEEAAVVGYTMTGGGYKDDGEGNITITIKNTKDVKVKISKVDLVNGKAVSGAEIELMNEAKEVIESWTSDEGPKEFELAPGHYTFREVNAPAGYTRVESEIGFKVNEEGQIILDSIEVTPADAVEVKDDTIFLKNELIKENPQTPTDSEEEEEEESSESEEESSSVPGSGEEEEEKPGNSEEEEEEGSTEEDGEGVLPGGGEEEEESAVDGESEVAETTVETEPMGTLPAEEEEEGSSVAAETEVPGTTAPTAPDTGDHSHLGLYLGLMGMAATAGIGLLVGTRKTKEEN